MDSHRPPSFSLDTWNNAEEYLPELLGLPETGTILCVLKDYYQSDAFRKAEHHKLPYRYGIGDQSLVTVWFADGAMAFVATKKIDTDDSGEIGHAGDIGEDLRREETTTYLYDGEGTTTKIMPDGEVKDYDGKHGDPETVVRKILGGMGKRVGRHEIVYPDLRIPNSYYLSN
ncbi:MAG: hypothetical protein JWL85_895 [Candidatus Saccharibacteria bacterium]|nr:hypothetical protein [Candidatus Saccharibacteria bacterium]